MTPQELLRHLKNEGDCTHTAISIYLETLNSFSRGHARQDPGVNSKKKPDSDEEEKEEEREEEEEKVAAELDNNCEDSYTESLCCDSAFAHKKEFSIFKFPEWFLEISWTESSLYLPLFSLFLTL